MIEYFLNLMDNQSTRLYLIFMTLTCFVNALMFEMFYAIIFSKLLLICFFVLSLIFFFANTLVVNMKEQYILNCLCLENVKNVLAKLSKVHYQKIINWEPNFLHQVVIESNYSLDNLLLMMENAIQLFFKIAINACIIILFKRKLIMLFILTTLIIIVNIFWLLNNRNQRSFIKMGKLHNYLYYLLHRRLAYLNDIFHRQFQNIIKQIHIKSYTSFVYVNFLLISMYLYMGFNSLEINDKIYVIIYARNSSYIFTLIQGIVTYYDNIKNNWDSIQKIINLPDKKTIPQISFGEEYQLRIEKLEFRNPNDHNTKKISLPKNLTLSNFDKVIIYGNSGVGKTTLFHVFKGLNQPLQCKIWYNNGLVKYDFNSIENNIMLVNSDMFKYFNENLKEFVFEDYAQDDKLFNYLIDVMDVRELCQKSNVNNFSISSGEMRRITLIKVFYQFYVGNYAILLLDEMDNSIHQILFMEILSKIFQSEYFKNKMIMVVSHSRALQQSELFNVKMEIKNDIIFVQ